MGAGGRQGLSRSPDSENTASIVIGRPHQGTTSTCDGVKVDEWGKVALRGGGGKVKGGGDD